MLHSLSILSILPLLWSPSHGRILGACSKGVEGQQVVRGRYWYTCLEGHLRKDGCLDHKDNKVKLNEAWNENGYEMTCYISDDGRLHIKQSGCIVDGNRYGPDDTWASGKFWYTCAKKTSYIIIETSGCVINGGRVRENQRATAGHIVYECKLKDTGAIGLCSIGCSQNGREYLIGESWEDDSFSYICSGKGGCHIEYQGCIVNGRRYTPGQTWTVDSNRGGGTYRCDVILGGLQGKINRID